ncbi:hypothetical protein FRB96_008077 [Tulasnella sp. 330]|nr:hypothetical protein FRB96_008077 [Tulasnella sp. 330]KAG8876620.1 hypothetical protein FRB97_004062 [Tulasnella sp. 331]
MLFPQKHWSPDSDDESSEELALDWESIKAPTFMLVLVNVWLLSVRIMALSKKHPRYGTAIIAEAEVVADVVVVVLDEVEDREIEELLVERVPVELPKGAVAEEDAVDSMELWVEESVMEVESWVCIKLVVEEPLDDMEDPDGVDDVKGGMEAEGVKEEAEAVEDVTMDELATFVEDMVIVDDVSGSGEAQVVVLEPEI